MNDVQSLESLAISDINAMALDTELGTEWIMNEPHLQRGHSSWVRSIQFYCRPHLCRSYLCPVSRCLCTHIHTSPRGDLVWCGWGLGKGKREGCEASG